MTGTVDTTFEVVEDAGRYLWLEIVRGRGSGLQVAVPKRHDDYEGDLRQRVLHLGTGEVIEATLQSENDKHTAWRFASVGDEQGNVASSTADRRSSAVADD